MVTALKQPPRHVFVTHGEPGDGNSFAQVCEGSTRVDVSVAQYGRTRIWTDAAGRRGELPHAACWLQHPIRTGEDALVPVDGYFGERQ